LNNSYADEQKHFLLIWKIFIMQEYKPCLKENELKKDEKASS
jgi:hypothetical protein